MARNFTGSKYLATKDMDVAEIAKLIRADIKSAVAESKLPGAKYTVKIRRYAGGQSIDVKAVSSISRRSPEGIAHTDRLTSMIEAYNRDTSDIMADYFNVKFYGNVSWETAEVDEDREVLRRASASGVRL